MRRLVIEGLETVTDAKAVSGSSDLQPEEAEYMELDGYDVPVLRRPRKRRRKVTNKQIDALREELGV